MYVPEPHSTLNRAQEPSTPVSSKFENFHFDGIELHRLVFSRKFVRGTPVNFFR